MPPRSNPAFVFRRKRSEFVISISKVMSWFILWWMKMKSSFGISRNALQEWKTLLFNTHFCSLESIFWWERNLHCGLLWAAHLSPAIGSWLWYQRDANTIVAPLWRMFQRLHAYQLEEDSVLGEIKVSLLGYRLTHQYNGMNSNGESFPHLLENLRVIYSRILVQETAHIC